MQDSLSTQRQQVRRTIRQARRQLSPEQQHSAAEQVMHNALHHPKIAQANNIALFLSFDGEINTQPLIDALWQQNKQIYLPVLHPFSAHHLLFLHYHPDSQLVKNRFNIAEPPLDVRDVLPPEQLDVMLIPLVAFDSQGQRLGMGGGFYDRTLSNWQKSGFYPIGLAHDCQHVELLPVAHWDIPLPEIITPKKIWRW
ncbi:MULTISPECIES: 5-formyltetrahydrofolate cyclo-ligase [Providencia]|uniref:5-formyltetrahydrofolate cyclo-ligase n=1 Tax=Providencia TaxID=586 RepID=UPI0019807119|nr:MULTISPECIES: 5-formyltetrahydrofolate cyclo-ligase [Providencia]MBN4863904.1 5-formyltetrahydrofolate cyclo-ligase [Providencia stuartii]MBN4873226.1 5-formyltetrahydrofolate cyclo-ligase [Providencia stuartii]MBN4877653.1 5-formyltetrahydrofolate cyclo-ligase [Providencia stuartii]MBN4882427.1 5-formyltetrahydrofolate cyclo-ligase [Providencia stuartii]